VSRRRSEVNVNNENRQHYRTGDKHHGEEQVFADERRRQRRGRVDLDDQQQENVERVEDRDAHRDLLAGIRRQVEHEQRHQTDDDARQNEVDRVEQSLSSDRDVELDVGVRLRATRIVFHILLRLDSQQIPFRTLVVVVQVYSVLDRQQVVDVVRQALVLDSDGVLVVRPRADLEGAQLLVEREELDVDRTKAFVDRRRLPDNETVGMDSHLGDLLHREITVSATHAYKHFNARLLSASVATKLAIGINRDFKKLTPLKILTRCHKIVALFRNKTFCNHQY